MERWGAEKARRISEIPGRDEKEGITPLLIFFACDGRDLERLLRHGFIHFEELVLVIRPGGNFEEGHAVGLSRGHCVRGAQLLRQL